MKLSDDEVIDRVRDALSTWAHEGPVSAADLRLLDKRATFTLVEAAPVAAQRRRRDGWIVAAAAAVVLAGVAVVAVLRTDEQVDVVSSKPHASGTIEIQIEDTVGVRGVTVTDDAVWVNSTNGETMFRIDPASNLVVDSFAIPSHVEGVRAVNGWLWLSRYEPNEAIRIDPATGDLVDRIAFDSQPNFATGGGRLWIIAERDGGSRVIEIDPDTGAEIDEIALDTAAGAATVDGDSMWIANGDAPTVTRFDLALRRTDAVVDVDGQPRTVVVAAGAIWVAVNHSDDEQVGSIVRIDPASNEVTDSITTSRWVHSLAVDGDSIWATNFLDGTISVIDATTSTIVATTPIGNRPGGVAVGHDSIWVAPHRRTTLVRIDPTQALEPAAIPEIAQTIDVGRGSTFMRCSGVGGPTVVLPGNKIDGAAWAIVEARLAQVTRVCAYEPVGLADPDQSALAGPADRAAGDLAETLDALGERGPFVIVGEWADGLDAQMFVGTHRADIVGLVLVNGMGADYFERIRSVFPTEAIDRMDQAIC